MICPLCKRWAMRVFAHILAAAFEWELRGLIFCSLLDSMWVSTHTEGRAEFLVSWSRLQDCTTKRR